MHTNLVFLLALAALLAESSLTPPLRIFTMFNTLEGCTAGTSPYLMFVGNETAEVATCKELESGVFVTIAEAETEPDVTRYAFEWSVFEEICETGEILARMYGQFGCMDIGDYAYADITYNSTHIIETASSRGNICAGNATLLVVMAFPIGECRNGCNAELLISKGMHSNVLSLATMLVLLAASFIF